MSPTRAAVAALTALILAASAAGQPAPATTAPATQPATPSALIERGAAYLLTAQEADGGWASKSGPGVSCLVLKALAHAPSVGPRHPAVQRGVAFILQSQREDGGIYSPEGMLKNYESSVALSLLSALRDPRHADAIRRLQEFLKRDQWDESEDKSLADPWYGGAGYGHGRRPDLSNTQMMLEALHDSGLPADDPTYKKALVFIQRCQALGEVNDQPWAKGSSQGGCIYSPNGSGESKADTESIDGRQELRCYGSMTYAGFKSMLYCGLKADDQRVQAARKWIGAHWTLDHNPNMPERQSLEGLYYYYHVFARALSAFGQDRLEDDHGRPHDWRAELTAALAQRQKPDGSWVNDADRWMEGIPALTTAYSLLALQAAYP